MEHSKKRVKQDKFLNLNIEWEDKPKMVQVSANFDDEFKENLQKLLQNFRYVFP